MAKNNNETQTETKKEPENPAAENGQKASEKTGKRFIWVKVRAYVDEAGEKRIDKGLYQTDEVFPRLEKAGADVCEIIKGDLPERKLLEIAKFFGVEVKDDTDILEKVLSKGVKLF